MYLNNLGIQERRGEVLINKKVTKLLVGHDVGFVYKPYLSTKPIAASQFVYTRHPEVSRGHLSLIIRITDGIRS